MRIIALLLLAALLTGCRAVFVPVPVDLDALPAAPPQDAATLFRERYDALDAPYDAMVAELNAPAWDDPNWRAELARRAAVWRAAIEALQALEQPAGAAWAAAWPALQAGLAEYHYAAGAVESAASTNQPVLLEPVRARLINGVNLVNEAMRLLGQE